MIMDWILQQKEAKRSKKKNISLPQVALNRSGHNTGGV
jgi:hypothetical protein